MKEEKTYRQEAVVPDRGLPFKLFRFEGADGNIFVRRISAVVLKYLPYGRGKRMLTLVIKSTFFRQESS